MARAKRYWLMKSEPSVYSIADLKRDGTTCWDGVRNYQARNFMRDDMRIGDGVLFYPSDPHYDPKSDPDNPTWMMVDIGYVASLKEPITLATLKQTPGLEKMLVIQRGSRLSVQPVTRQEWDIVMGLGELAA
jgi:predicted RNA-binding protein with PUA-like domain